MVEYIGKTAMLEQLTSIAQSLASIDESLKRLSAYNLEMKFSEDGFTVNSVDAISQTKKD